MLLKMKAKLKSSHGSLSAEPIYIGYYTVARRYVKATINVVRRFNSEKSCLQIKSKHLQ